VGFGRVWAPFDFAQGGPGRAFVLEFKWTRALVPAQVDADLGRRIQADPALAPLTVGRACVSRAGFAEEPRAAGTRWLRPQDLLPPP